MRLTDDLEVAITRRSVGGGGGTPLFRDTAFKRNRKVKSCVKCHFGLTLGSLIKLESLSFLTFDY